MNILFLSYWGLNEGLTAATVFPHVNILAGFPHVDKIILATIERNNRYDISALPQNNKIEHFPLISKRLLPNIINKIYDFIDFPDKLSKLCRKEKIDKIIARGSPPGALAMMVSDKTGIPFYVESFEPHSEYMQESGTWKNWDPRYRFQHKWEKEQKQKATALMPVAENYRKRLIAEGVKPEIIDVLPCCVPLHKFRFSYESRNQIRETINCRENTVGIYTGKFGGIYYSEEAFQIFQHVFKIIGDAFFLIILSPDDPKWIQSMLLKYKIPMHRVFFKSVDYQYVPGYLSASDFAFSLQSPKKSNLYLSPIKNAEYWAAGLPVLITAGVGDDAGIIKREKAGAIFRGVEDREGLGYAIKTIRSMLSHETIRKDLHAIAEKYRNFQIVEDIYKKWYGM